MSPFIAISLKNWSNFVKDLQSMILLCNEQLFFGEVAIMLWRFIANLLVFHG
jgi:hypothetical protein